MPLRGIPARLVNGSDFTVDLGLMRDRVTLLTVSRTKGAGGFATDAAAEHLTVFGEVTPEAGMEPYESNALRGQSRWRVRIRYRTDINAGARIQVRGRTYEVLEPPLNLDGRQRFLWLRVGLVEST